MVFKRRKRLSTARRVREAIYPRTGWRRAIEYFGHRLKRLPDTPHRIALGFACGVFVSFSPFFGLHFIYAGLVAFLLRGNVIAAFLGTLVGNPLTFPFIATVSLTLGRRIYDMSGAHHQNFTSVKDSFVEAMSGLWDSFLAIFGLADPAWDKLEAFWSDVFLPYYVGGLIPGLITAAAFYFLSRPLIAAYQARRRTKLLAKAEERLRRKQELAAKIKTGKLANEGQ